MTSLPEHSTSIIDRLQLLQTRIREAKGADRELDAEIFAAFNNGRVEKMWNAWTPGPFWHVHIGARIVVEIPHYTTDPDGLGACVALMREAYPGVAWERTTDGRFALRGFRSAPQWSYDAEKLANDCLTFLDAIVSAKISEEESSTLTASENEKRE